MHGFNPSEIELHVNSVHAGKTVKWSGTDNFELFSQHMSNPKTAEQLRSLGFDDPNCIDYTFNSHGFRTREFTDEPAGIALGCSFTAGIGVPEKDTWPAILSSMMNFPIYNLGVGGSSLDTAFRLLDFYIDRLNVKFVTLCITEKRRFEVFDNRFPISIHHSSLGPAFIMPYLKHRIATDSRDADINVRKNMLAIQYLCDRRGIPLISLNLLEFEFDKSARDLAHAGPRAQKMFATKMYNKVKEIMP